MDLGRLLEIARRPESREARIQALADQIRSTGDFRWVGLYDVDRERGLVINIAWSGAGAPAFPTFPITKGLTSRAIAGKRTVNVGDVAGDADYLTALGTTRSEIIVPIIGEESEDVVGTLDVESERVNAFTPEVQTFLEGCADAIRLLWPK
jgi:L-methionine (R)-S-oxide reductase